MVNVKVYTYKGKYRVKIEGGIEEVVDVLKSIKNSPEGEQVRGCIDEEYLKAITSAMDLRRAKDDNP